MCRVEVVVGELLDLIGELLLLLEDHPPHRRAVDPPVRRRLQGRTEPPCHPVDLRTDLPFGRRVILAPGSMANAVRSLSVGVRLGTSTPPLAVITATGNVSANAACCSSYEWSWSSPSNATAWAIWWST